MNPLIGPAAGVEGFYQAVGVQSVSPTPQRPARSERSPAATLSGCRRGIHAASATGPGRFGRNSYTNTRVREMYASACAPFPQYADFRPPGAADCALRLAAKGPLRQIAGWERAFWFGSDDTPTTRLAIATVPGTMRSPRMPSRTRCRRRDGSRRLPATPSARVSTSSIAPSAPPSRHRPHGFVCRRTARCGVRRIGCVAATTLWLGPIRVA